MAIPTTNDFTGRQWRIVTTGPIPFGNFRINGGVWTGGTAADVASFVDEAGREFDFIYPSAGHLVIGPMHWIAGPAAITVFPAGHGQMLWYVGTK